MTHACVSLAIFDDSFERRGFRVNSHQRLGAGKPQQHPRTVVELQFQTVGAVHAV